MDEKAYSYHNFMFPFSYFDENLYEWISQHWHPIEVNIDSNRDYYNSYQYFNDKARNLVHNYKGDEESIKGESNKNRDFQLYSKFKYIKYNEKGNVEINYKYKYKIELKDKFYELDINSINIRIFRGYKIAILSFELINNNYSILEDIKNINNYGRRVFSPLMSVENNEYTKDSFYLTAHCIEIAKKIGDKIVLKHNFIDTANVIKDDLLLSKKSLSNDSNDKIINRFNSDLVVKLLKLGGNKDYSKKDKISFPEQLQVKPILDDRMFVASMINYDRKAFDFLSFKFKCRIEDISYRDKYKLYPILFLDDNFVTCQNESMMNDLFNKHLYLRWTGCGSLDCITEYGFVKITNGMNIPGVGPPFLNMYMDMIKIALLQRCKLEAIESRVSNLNFNNKNKVSFEQIDEIWEELITYKKDLGMKVLTFQEQGVECYDILRKSLRIDEIEAYVDDEMKKIHEYVELQKQNRTNKAIRLLTVITVLIGSQALIVQLINDYIFEEKEVFLIFCAIIDGFLLLRILISMIKTISSDFIEKLKNELIDDIFIVLALVVLIFTFIFIIA